MSRWSRSLPMLAVIGAVAVAGCGGGDYPSKPNEICKTSVAKIKKIARPKAVSDLHVYFLKSQQVLTDETRQLREVKPPKDKLAAYQAFVTGVDRELAVLRRATSTVAANPKRAVTLLQQPGLREDVNAKAKTAGLSQCAKAG